VWETVRAGKRRVEAVYLARTLPPMGELVDGIQSAGIPITSSSIDEISSLTGSSHHQGIAARVGPFLYADLDDVLFSPEAIHGPALVLDQVQDPANLGNIIRSAECLGACAVVTSKDRSVAVTPVVEKAAAGASAHLRIIRVVNLVRAIDQLKSSGFWIYGTSQEGRHSLYSVDLSGRIAFVLGSEGKGMRRLVREKCDEVVSVPIVGRTESLNVSQTAAIVLAETLRQRIARKETIPEPSR
jgi:23S rRNA (guanosine2251-2'-O)-methyltransferase